MGWAQRARANAFLRGAMARLQALHDRRLPDDRRRFPKARPSCRTCAFNPAMKGLEGWDSTTMHVINAIRDCRPFYCHAPLRPGETSYRRHAKPKLCAGFAVILGDLPAARQALCEAAIDMECGR